MPDPLCGGSLTICLANLIPNDLLFPPTRLIAEGDAVSIEYEARGRTSKGIACKNYYVTILTIRSGNVVEVRPHNDTAPMLRMLG